MLCSCCSWAQLAWLAMLHYDARANVRVCVWTAIFFFFSFFLFFFSSLFAPAQDRELFWVSWNMLVVSLLQSTPRCLSGTRVATRWNDVSTSCWDSWEQYATACARDDNNLPHLKWRSLSIFVGINMLSHVPGMTIISPISNEGLVDLLDISLVFFFFFFFFACTIERYVQ